MSVRSKLFIRIFLGFWLVTIAILLSWLVAARYFDAMALSPPKEDRSPPQKLLLQLMYDLQHLEQDKLPPMLQRLESQQHLRLFVLDSRGEELRGREVPAPIKRAAAQLNRDKTRGRLVIRTDQGTLLGHRFFRADTGQMRVLLFYPNRQREPLRFLLENLWLRILLAIAISGVVCYGLSRLITRRLATLEHAASQLAEGDLEVRIPVREQGGDETSDLARSFNSMAGELQRRINTQKQLLGDVSHELRSPLARLRIALALAEQDRENLPEHLQRIEREAERLEELIAQLLSSQEQQLELSDHIDLGQLLQEVCENSRFEGEPEGKKIVYTGPRQATVVATAGDLLYKCFDNLVRNALQHSESGGVVTVTASTTSEDILVSVQDYGPGVPPEELAHIFEAFYRVDKARSRETGGYGLGLSIARRAVEQHGGRITAENAGGLRVSVQLPLAKGH